jgi:hypothetical protein
MFVFAFRNTVEECSCTERYIEINDTVGPEEGFEGLLNVGNQTF